MTAPSILVVDSDGEHAAACTSFLEDSGFAVTVARDLRTAEAAVQAGELDLVLLDSSLDGKDTSAIAQGARETGAEVFGMSAIHVGATNREIAIALHGCVDHWEKPVAADTALEWFRRVLGDRFPKAVEPASPEVGRVAAQSREGAGWGERPTNVTPVDPAEAVAEAREADASVEEEVSPIEAEAPDLGETPVPDGGRSGHNATTKVTLPDPSALRIAEQAGSEPEPDATASPADPPAPSLQVPPLFAKPESTAGGDLSETTFAAVFAAQVDGKATGALRVESGGVSKEIFVVDGDVVGIRSAAADDGLGAILLSDGLLRADQEDAIRRNLGASALEIPETFVDAGVIELDDLATVENIVIERRLQSVFGWTEGTWALTNQKCPSAVRASGPVSGAGLLERGIRYGLDTGVLRSVLDAQLRCPAGWRTDAPKGRFLSWEQAIVDKIDGKTRTSSVILGAPDRDDALRLVALLVLTGHVGFEP